MLPEPEAAAIRDWAGEKAYSPTMLEDSPEKFRFLQWVAVDKSYEFDPSEPFAWQYIKSLSDDEVVKLFLEFLLSDFKIIS